MKHKEIIENTNKYYTNKVVEYGNTPQGVDWNSFESQHIRFNQLAKVINPGKTKFSILDYGCGYGALLKYLGEHFSGFDYIGFDISDEMINRAKELYKETQAKWVNSLQNISNVDFLIASGIFNVKLETNTDSWEKYIIKILNDIFKITHEGFSFNMLTIYSDKEYMKDNLYYADPGFFFDYCKKNFSRNVALLHDYDLYEFTIIVRK